MRRPGISRSRVEFGARLHLCHVSTAGAVALLRVARRRRVYAVSGEVTPHHLVLTVDDAVRGGLDFKMKPPLREASDVAALVRRLEDGTIDAIGTDHAPHAEAKKAQGLARAPFGAIGMETAFPVLYTHLVVPGRLSLRRLVEALVTGPARVAGRTPASPDGLGRRRVSPWSTSRPSAPWTGRGCVRRAGTARSTACRCAAGPAGRSSADRTVVHPA